MDYQAILTTAMSGIVLFVITQFYIKFRKRWEQQDRLQVLYQMKIDSMIYALGEVNSGIGEKFRAEYKQKFKELLVEKNFISEPGD